MAEETPQPATPTAPVDSTDDLLRQILAEQQQHRADVADLQAQLAASKQPAPPVAPAVALSPEEAQAARLEEMAQHPYYCPGCGALYDYRRPCTGKSESPHPSIEVVSTDELKTGNLTPAPAVA